MPRRSDDSERVGLCSIVRARRSSKLAKRCGPLTKSMIAFAFSFVVPGGDVDQHQPADEVGARRPRAPSTSGRRATCRRRRRPRAPAPRRRRRRRRPGSRACRPGRRARTSDRARAGRRRPAGRSRASATVSQVWAFCAPPWTSTSSGGDVAPHERADTRRPPPTSTSARRTIGGPAHVRPYSEAFSWNSPNSSYAMRSMRAILAAGSRCSPCPARCWPLPAAAAPPPTARPRPLPPAPRRRPRRRPLRQQRPRRGSGHHHGAGHHDRQHDTRRRLLHPARSAPGRPTRRPHPPA